MTTEYEELVITEYRTDAWILSPRGHLTREATRALRDEIDKLLEGRPKRPLVVDLAVGARTTRAGPVDASREELVHEAVTAGSELCVVCAPEEPSLTIALLCCRDLSLKCTSLLLTR